MQHSLIITVIGPDRPGLVESLARVVSENGGNWTRSRMAHLAGQFAGILEVSVGAEDSPKLREALHLLSRDQLSVTIATDEISRPGPTVGLALKMDLVGQDRPGIIRQISKALAERGVNVEELASECESAPWSGETLFKAQASLQAPEGTDLEALRTALEEIAQDLMVDISLVRPL